MKKIIPFIFLISFSSFGLDVPRLTSPVIDLAGLLSLKVKQSLSNALIEVKKQTGNEIAVLTINSLEDETIEGYSIKVTDQWKLGNKDKDNGALFLISVKDRQMRIEVGQGLEGVIPDVVAGRIINDVKAYFKRGDYSSGIILGVSLIAEKSGAKLTNTPRVTNRRSGSALGTGLFILIAIIAMIFGRGGRGGGGGLMAGMLLGSALGGGRSRGGFGGFGGGGGFSGGGASGGW